LLALDAGHQENVQFREEIWEAHPMNLDEILVEVTKMNPDLKRQRLAESERLIAIRQIQAEYLPELDFNLGYSYNDQESEANQLRFLTTQGLNYNFTARLNIFQGFNQSRRIQQAKLQQKNVQLQSEQIRVNLENQTRTAWVNYKQTGSVFNLESTNFEAAEKTLDISKEKYNQGLMSAVEFREAQRNWLNARLRLLNAEYDVRIHEIELMRLSGKFLREKK
jgi:outer membrane protein TolC